MRFVAWLKSIDWRYRRLQADNEQLSDQLELAQIEVARASAARSEMQGEVIRLRAESAELWQRLDASLESERLVYRTEMNVAYQQKFGFIPFPGAPHMENSIKRPDDLTGALPSRHLNARDLVAQQTAADRAAFFAKEEAACFAKEEAAAPKA